MKLIISVMTVAIVGLMLLSPLITIGFDRGDSIMFWLGLTGCVLFGLIAIIAAVQIHISTKDNNFDPRKLNQFTFLVCLFGFLVVSIVALRDFDYGNGAISWLEIVAATSLAVAALATLWKMRKGAN